MKFIYSKLSTFNISLRLSIYLILFISLSSGLLWAVLNKPDSGIKFNHALHKEQGAECKACHTVASGQNRLMTMPNHDSCKTCHADAISNKCGLCHTNSDQKTALRKGKILSPLVKFNHTMHSSAGIACKTCHIKAPENKKVTGNTLLPKMNVCVSCHTQQGVSKKDNCSFCHVKGYEKIRPASHSPFWEKTHGKKVKYAGKENCNICHTKKNGTDCISCHKKEKPKNHTLGWRIRTHAHKAMTNRDSCATCHTQNECVACHKNTKPFSHTGLWGGSYSRHCNHCHISGSSYVSGSVGGNCTMCHNQSQVFMKHQSKRIPTHYRDNCTNCHGVLPSAPKIKHPYPSGSTTCVQCH